MKKLAFLIAREISFWVRPFSLVKKVGIYVESGTIAGTPFFNTLNHGDTPYEVRMSRRTEQFYARIPKRSKSGKPLPGPQRLGWERLLPNEQYEVREAKNGKASFSKVYISRPAA